MLVAANTSTPSTSFPTPDTYANGYTQHLHHRQSHHSFAQEIQFSHDAQIQTRPTVQREQRHALAHKHARTRRSHLRPRSAQRVNLVDEDDRRFVLACQLKQLPYEPARVCMMTPSANVVLSDHARARQRTFQIRRATLKSNRQTKSRRTSTALRWRQLSLDTIYRYQAAIKERHGHIVVIRAHSHSV
jgi:hypothetical protein